MPIEVPKDVVILKKIDTDKGEKRVPLDLETIPESEEPKVQAAID